VIESPGVRGCLFGDLGQVARRLSAQRVSRLRPAASFAAGHDPPLEFAGLGVQAACRDHRGRQRRGVGTERGLVLDRAGQHQVAGSGGVVGPPDTGEVPCLEPVVARIAFGVRCEEPDLIQVDVARGEAGPQAPPVQLEADCRFADPGRAAHQEDLPAATVGLTSGRPRWGHARLPLGRAESRPAAAPVPDEPGHLAGRDAGRVHAHVSEITGVHTRAVVSHPPHQVRVVVPRATGAGPAAPGNRCTAGRRRQRR